MLSSSVRRLAVFAAAVMPLMGTVAITQAGLLVSESFEYANSTALLASSSGGSGLSGSWSVSTSTGSSAVNVVPGLSFSTYHASGNAVQVLNTEGGGVDETRLGRALAVSAPAGETLWSSYLFKRAVTPDPADDAAVELRVGGSATTGYATSRFRSLAKAYGSETNVGVAIDSSDNRASFAMSNLETYLVLSKFGPVNSSASAAKTAKLWILSESAFDAIKADGVSESELNAVATATATDTVSANTTRYAFDVGNFIQIAGFRNWNPAKTIAFGVVDEVRFGFGTSPTEAGLLHMPEPTVAFTAIAGLAALAGRRRAAGR